MYQIVTQAVGFLSTAIMIGSFQCKNSRKLIYLQLCANITYLLHYVLLGAYSGCISLVLSCVRNYLIASRRPWTNWKWWPWLLIVVNLAGSLYTWDGPFSILPLIGVSALTLANWSRNGKMIRITNFAVSSPSWIIYSLHTGSLAGVVSELICMGSVAISVLRYGWKALDVVEE